MSCSAKTLRILMTTLAWDATTPGATFIPCTGWMSTAAIKSVRVVWEMRARTFNLKTTPALQVANTEDTPGALTTIAAERVVNGFWYEDYVDVQTALDASQLVRFGFNVVTGATGLATARVSGRVEVRDF